MCAYIHIFQVGSAFRAIQLLCGLPYLTLVKMIIERMEMFLFLALTFNLGGALFKRKEMQKENKDGPCRECTH